MSSFDRLQSKFGEMERAVFGLTEYDCQLFQPSKLFAKSDQVLWSFFNLIPEAGLLYCPTKNEFFPAYSQVIFSLIASSPLDPVAAAQAQLQRWGAQPPAWNCGYTGMLEQLKQSVSLRFQFSTPPISDIDYWGLWGGVPPNDSVNQTFTSGFINVQIFFGHLLSFTPMPDEWYTASALSLAYRNRSGPPWDPSSPITWETTFGANGSLQRFLSTLIIACDIKVEYSSTMPFSTQQQQEIRDHYNLGLWPYYLTSDATNVISFDGDGRLLVQCSSAPSIPVIMAAIVLPAEKYLGL